jgi:hypothetical protein
MGARGLSRPDPARLGFIRPPLKLANVDEMESALPNRPDLALRDPPFEGVAADADRLGGFVQAKGDPGVRFSLSTRSYCLGVDSRGRAVKQDQIRKSIAFLAIPSVFGIGNPTRISVCVVNAAGVGRSTEREP